MFLEYGYGLASLDIIAREARVAKRTIYQYFGDKAELFGAVIRRLNDKVLLPLPQLETDTRPIAAQVLTDFADRLLTMVLSPEAIQLYRIVVGEAGRFPELAKQFYHNAPAHVLSSLTHYLERQTELGYLHPIDATIAAEQFLNMVLGEPHRRVLLGIDQIPDPEQIRRRVDHAATLFLNGCHGVPSD